MPLIDAHNHLQDDRLSPYVPEVLEWYREHAPCIAVVNGSCESNWEAVAQLAEHSASIVPSFGYHPWYLSEATSSWKETLVSYLDRTPSGVGEIGLDRWKKGLDFGRQREFFRTQLELAAERNLPASIHCLEAWGALLEELESSSLPKCGFLLHSYGGSIEMIRAFVDLGAYFSLPGSFLGPGKEHKLETFRNIPPERILLETDAPDQLLPREMDRFRILDTDGARRLNHPGNIEAIYDAAALSLSLDRGALEEQVCKNFARLFRSIPVSVSKLS